MTDPQNLEKKNGSQRDTYPPRGGENNNSQKFGENKGGVQGNGESSIKKGQINGMVSIPTPPKPTTISGDKENK